MKILYAIQGTGNGHLSRARDVIPALMKKGVVDVLVSGTQADVDLGYPIRYKLKGLSFTFGKKGGVDIIKTYRKANLKHLLKEIKSLPIEDYDLVISDFEPVSAWACKQKKIKCVGVSHQSAAISKDSPKPSHKDLVGKLILKKYAPCTVNYGFHFESYNNSIFTPVIRKEIRELKITDKGHYTVYLPAYSDERIIKNLLAFKSVKWEVFSKHSKKEYLLKNIIVRPIDNQKFISSLASCTGVLCGAGFETPAEAMFLGKKLLVIPMKAQYEQHCNAAALAKLNIPVIKSLKSKYAPSIQSWIDNYNAVKINYADNTEQIIGKIVDKHAKKSIHYYSTHNSEFHLRAV